MPEHALHADRVVGVEGVLVRVLARVEAAGTYRDRGRELVAGRGALVRGRDSVRLTAVRG